MANEKKLYIEILAHFKSWDGGNKIIEAPRIISAQTEHNANGSFKQLSGHVYMKDEAGKIISTGAAWYWGLKNGKLYREPDGRGKVWMSMRGIYCAYEIAQAVEEAFKTGKGVIPNPFEVAPAVQPQPKAKQAITSTKSAKSVEVPTPIVEADADIDEEVAVLDGMGESPLIRLQKGDPTLFVELGAPQKYAERWAAQIRDGGVTLNDIEDVTMIRGIGKKIASKLAAAWHEKFDA